MINIYLRLDTATTLKKNRNHPVLLMVTWGSEVRHKRIKGFSCKKDAWDFDDRCYMRSERKNKLLEAYVKKAWRVADYMDEWDYSRFVKELNHTKGKKESKHKKLFEYLKELEVHYFENDQMGYSDDFKGLISFLKKCFTRDMPLQDFGDRELKVVLKKMDERGIKGWNYLKTLKTAMCEAMTQGYLKPEECLIKTQYSPRGYNINKRHAKSSYRVKKNRIKHMTEEEKEMVVDFYHTADLPPTQKKHLAYWVLGYKLFGVNFIDVAHLKWEDINNSYWKYKRSKTGIGSATGKPVPEAALNILKEYDTGGKYILDVLNGYDENAERIHTRLRNYRANMRRTFRILSKRINFSDEPTKSWYYSDSRYSINQYKLTEQEIDSLRSAAHLLSAYKNYGVFPDFADAIDKVLQAVKIQKQLLGGPNFTDQFIQIDERVPIVGNEHIPSIIMAIRRKNCLAIEYRKYTDRDAKQRIIEPYLLKSFEGRWYIIGKRADKDGFATYSLDRVVSIEPTEKYFSRKKVNFNQYYAHSLGITVTNDPPLDIVLSFTSKQGNYVRLSPIHSSQTLLIDNEHELRIALKLQSTYELWAKILSYGDDVQVLGPDELRQKIKDISEKTYKKYK